MTNLLRPLTPMRNSEHGRRLSIVCFPHAGAGHGAFMSIENELTFADWWCAEYPGRHQRADDPCVGSISDLADLLFVDIQRIDRGPIALLGASFGAWVAYEVAARMQSKIDACIVLSSTPPCARRADPIASLPDREMLGALEKRIGALDDLTGLRDLQLLRMISRTVRTDLALAEAYAPSQKKVDGVACYVYTGLDDSSVRGDVGQWASHFPGALLRWFSGGHFLLKDALRDVASQLRSDLSRLIESDEN